jgi:hypothetical protein
VPAPRKPMVGSLPVCCCADAASGQTVADPKITLMKSRRRIAFPKTQGRDLASQLQQGFGSGGMGVRGQFAQQQS